MPGPCPISLHWGLATCFCTAVLVLNVLWSFTKESQSWRGNEKNSYKYLFNVMFICFLGFPLQETLNLSQVTNQEDLERRTAAPSGQHHTRNCSPRSSCHKKWLLWSWIRWMPCQLRFDLRPPLLSHVPSHFPHFFIISLLLPWHHRFTVVAIYSCRIARATRWNLFPASHTQTTDAEAPLSGCCTVAAGNPQLRP